MEAAVIMAVSVCTLLMFRTFTKRTNMHLFIRVFTIFFTQLRKVDTKEGRGKVHGTSHVFGNIHKQEGKNMKKRGFGLYSQPFFRAYVSESENGMWKKAVSPVTENSHVSEIEKIRNVYLVMCCPLSSMRKYLNEKTIRE